MSGAGGTKPAVPSARAQLDVNSMAVDREAAISFFMDEIRCNGTGNAGDYTQRAVRMFVCETRDA